MVRKRERESQRRTMRREETEMDRRVGDNERVNETERERGGGDCKRTVRAS